DPGPPWDYEALAAGRVRHARQGVDFGTGGGEVLQRILEHVQRRDGSFLATAGTFLTQQVTPDFWPELRPFFPRATIFPDHSRGYTAWFEAHGYAVTLRRHDYRVAWESLGDLVAHLLVAPWTIPDFEVERDIEALLALEAAL